MKTTKSWVCPRERFFYPPPPHTLISILYMTQKLFFTQKDIYFVLFQGCVRLEPFLDRALRLGQTRGAERCGQDRPSSLTIFNKISIYLGLGQIKTLSGPSAAARTGQRAGVCSHMTNFIHVLNMRCMYKCMKLPKSFKLLIR